jgi:hypothetical protein
MVEFPLEFAAEPVEIVADANQHLWATLRLEHPAIIEQSTEVLDLEDDYRGTIDRPVRRGRWFCAIGPDPLHVHGLSPAEDCFATFEVR